MKKLFLLLLCAAFAMVGCEGMEQFGGGDDTITPEQPIFVTNADGDYVVSKDGGTVEVEVATNIDYTLSIPEDAQSWISHTDTRSIRQEVLVLTIAQNTVDKQRKATMSLLNSDGELLSTFTVVQNAAIEEDMSDIEISANKTQVEVGEVIIFKVAEKSGKDVTASSTIYNNADYSIIKNARFKTTAEGTLRFFATRNGKTSNILVVKVGDGTDEPVQTEGAFLHKVLLVDHTGVNCGYCPGAIDNLRYLANNTSWGEYFNEVTCHAGSFASGDPAMTETSQIYNGFQGNAGMIGGYPTIVVNFYNKSSSANYSNVMNVLQGVVKKSGADVGIALNVSRGTGKVYCSAQIKAAVSNEYKVNAWLLENNIYSPNQNGATKEYHYYYNHALRSTSETVSYSDFSGKSLGMIYTGETRDYDCEIPVQSSWEMNNLEVLIVVTARNGSNNWDVVNTAVCGVDQTTPFAYVQ